MCGRAQVVAGLDRHRAEALEDVEFEAERAIAGIGDSGFDLAELRGSEAHLTGKSLPMNEDRIQRRCHQLVAVLRGHLDEIAEYIVVSNLQRLDAGLVGIARLHLCDHAA